VSAYIRPVPCSSSRRPGPVGRLLLAAALGLSTIPVAAGCREHPDDRVVARVGDWTLGRQRLADLLVLAQPMPLDSATVGAIVEQWIALAALAQRADAGADLDGDSATAASLWLELREALLDADRRLRLGASARVSREQARAEFDADSLRLLAHVLRRTGPFTPPAERDLQRRTAQGILDVLLRGGSWADAVKQSEDAANRTSSGLLGLLRVDELPPPLQGAASRLLPGQVSSVIESPDGYHILNRPRWADVADLYTRLLSDRQLEEADAYAILLLQDSLHVKIAAGAPAVIRSLAAGRTLPDEQAPLATWGGGALSRDVATRYVLALPEKDRARLAGDADEGASRFIQQIAVRQAQVDFAERRGVQADTETLSGLADMHHADVRRWKAALSDGAPVFSRAALDRYLDRLVARQIPFEPVAPLFRQWLLEPLEWSRDRATQNEAVTTAQRLLQAADSGRAGPGRP
jgi:PPIC-type PPIASE domain